MNTQTLPTIRIVSDDHPDGYKTINLTDFNPDEMREYGVAPLIAPRSAAAVAADILAGNVAHVTTELAALMPPAGASPEYVAELRDILAAAATQEADGGKRKGVLDAIATANAKLDALAV